MFWFFLLLVLHSIASCSSISEREGERDREKKNDWMHWEEAEIAKKRNRNGRTNVGLKRNKRINSKFMPERKPINDAR